MKTTTAAFNVAWGNRRVRFAVYKITYKRRYWNGSAYVLESTSRTIHRREIDRISGISDKFDIPLQNRILPSNVSIVLNDKGYKWLPTNTANGVWRKDATATTGYDPVGSEFTIHYGYITDSDGTEELLSMFVGVIQDDPKFDSVSGTVTFQLVAKNIAKLEAADASEVGTAVTDGATNPANGNGALDTFSTQKTSLWAARNIRVNGVAKTQGTDYTLDNLNDAETEATIVFESGSIPGAVPILFDGDQWHRNKSISELVGLLLDEAGVASGDREIEEPIFSGVDQSASINTSAEWAAGTLTNADATVTPGTLKRKWFCIDDFADGDYTASPIWTATERSGASNVVTAAGGEFDIQVVGAGSQTTKLETWHMETVGGAGKNSGTWVWRQKSAFTNNTGVGATEIYTTTRFSEWPNAYLGCTISHDSAGSCKFYVDGTLQATFALSLGAYHEFRVTVSGGTMTLYVDGVSKGSGTTIMGSFGAFHAQAVLGNLGANNPLDNSRLYLDDIYYREAIDVAGAITTGEMSWMSAEQDLLAAPTIFLPVTKTVTANGGTYTFKTNVAAASGGPYDGELNVDGTDTPTSALKRYAKIGFSTVVAKGTVSGPEFTVLTLNWRGSSLFVKSADFTGQNCLQAMTDLAKLGGMEWGQDGAGVVYFRNKTVAGSADLTISQKNVIAAVTDYSPGYRDVKNKAQVRYGKSGTDGYYFAEYAAADASEASPTTAQRFGEKVISLDLQRLIFANDAQVAEAVAQKLYEIHYRPKRRLKLRCRIIPQLELSDKVSVSFHDSPLIEKAIFGDPLQRFPVVGPNSRTLARDILMKVVGHSPDVMKAESVLDLEEVLS